MYEKETLVKNKSGIHARPASVFVKLAKGFSSSITIKNLSCNPVRSANAKSMLNILTLCLVKGTSVSICAEGDDQEAAVEALINLIDSGCGEGLE